MRGIVTKLRRSPGLHVAMGFVVILALSLAFAGLVALYPSQEERCTAQCAGTGMVGELTPTYSLIQSGGNQFRRGPLVCKCVNYRTL